MLHILGMFGRGIGIALLCILLLLAVMLLAVLFVPIRYDASGKRTEEGIITGRIRLSWLFRFVTCFALWEGKLHYGLKIFGVPVYDNLRKKQKEKKQKVKKQKGKKPKKNKRTENRETEKRQPEAAEKGRTEEKKEIEYRAVSRYEPENTLADRRKAERSENERRVSGEPPEEEKTVEKRYISGERAKEEKPGEERSKTKKLAGRGRIRALLEKIRAFFHMLHKLARQILAIPNEILDKLRRINETVQAYREFLEREDFKRAVALCKKQMFRVWKNLRPRRIKADIHFGFEDPSITGQILAAAGMLYPVLGKDIVLRPDFEETVCTGRAQVRGRITLAVLLKALWILYFNRDMKRLISIWKREEALHGGQ